MHDEILMLALVLIAALAGGRIASRFGYPMILGEIAAGIVLGPPLFGLLDTNEAIQVLGEFGVLLMMLYIGMHLDLGDLRKASVPGLLAAAGGFVVPAGLGMGLMFMVGRPFIEALFVGLAMGVTSLAVNGRILVDLKILDTRIAHVLVAGALLCDVAVLVIFSALVGTDAPEAVSIGSAAVAGGKALAFGIGAWLVGIRLLPLLRRLGTKRDLDRGGLLVVVIAFGLLSAWAAEIAGIHAILGAFVAGLVLDDRVIEARASREVQQRLSLVSIGILAPFFFVSAGFEVSLGVFRTDLPLLIGVVVFATVGKIGGTALFYALGRRGWREGLVVGAGMNGRGAVEIIVAELALQRGLIDQEVFSVLVFMAIITTATVPILLPWGVRWLRQRGELVKASNRSLVLIVGAGPIASYIADVFKVAAPVKLIDTNRVNQLSGQRAGLEVVAGSGFDEVVLERAGIETAQTFISATPNAETNILSAKLAVDMGVPDVSVLLRDSDARSFDHLLTGSGIQVIPAPEDMSEWEHALRSGDAVSYEYVVNGGQIPDWVAKPTQWRAPDPGFPLVVVDEYETIPKTEGVRLNAGNRVMLLSKSGFRNLADLESELPDPVPVDS